MDLPPAAPPAAVAAAATNLEADRAAVAALDIRFQAATKRNDVAVIDAILHPDYVLVMGDGRRASRADLIEEARSRRFVFEIQDEEPGTQTVQMYGPDTAVVTALLRLKGTRDGQPFDRRLWFSDTYVRTAAGWKYAYAQASLPLPDGAP